MDPNISKLPEVVEWEAHEYTHHEKTPQWFWVVGVIGGLAVILSLAFGNLLLAFLILLATIVVLMYGRRSPERVSFVIHQRGIKVSNRLYPYEHLRSFAILDQPDRPKRIMLTSEKIFLPHIMVPLQEEVDPELVRTVLRRYLPEEPQTEPLADILADYFRF